MPRRHIALSDSAAKAAALSFPFRCAIFTVRTNWNLLVVISVLFFNERQRLPGFGVFFFLQHAVLTITLCFRPNNIFSIFRPVLCSRLLRRLYNVPVYIMLNEKNVHRRLLDVLEREFSVSNN